MESCLGFSLYYTLQQSYCQEAAAAQAVEQASFQPPDIAGSMVRGFLGENYIVNPRKLEHGVR